MTPLGVALCRTCQQSVAVLADLSRTFQEYLRESSEGCNGCTEKLTEPFESCSNERPYKHFAMSRITPS